MSTYSDLSKKIGWDRPEEKPISITEAEQLLKEVTNGSAESFEKVFTLHRFMVLDGATDDQIAAFHIVEQAFAMGRGLFS